MKRGAGIGRIVFVLRNVGVGVRDVSIAVIERWGGSSGIELLA